MRRPDWDIRFNEYLIAVRDREFRYGVHDCCIFAADAIHEMTGVDPMAEFRGRYDSVETGRQALREIGAGTLLKTLYKKFGKPLPGAFGCKGDLAWYNGALGIVLGPQAIFIGIDGYKLVPLAKLDRIFKTG